MKNAFQEIEPQDSLPEEIKTQTLGNLGAISFVMDLVDLFVANPGNALLATLPPHISKPLDQETDDPLAPGPGAAT